MSSRQRFEDRQEKLLRALKKRQVGLPLRYYRQQAHFTTPASDLERVEKAIRGGFAATPRLLEKFRISTAELAKVLEVSEADVRALLEVADPRAPLVMIDGEDAQALTAEVIQKGRKNAVKAFGLDTWQSTLRYYRPSGFELPYCAGDLFEVLAKPWKGLSAERYPIDGVIFPKLEHPEQMAWLCDLLRQIETQLKLPRGRIKVQFLVESAWAVIHLERLVDACLPRLTGIIFGIADYNASISLSSLVNDHPIDDWVRMTIVNAAGAAGVPAIDSMTMSYPVAEPLASPEQNKVLLLRRMKQVFDDARHGHSLGMSGKWVGHPLQLFAVLLAYRTAQSSARIEDEVSRIEAYLEAVRDNRGTTMIAGTMTDRATDRQTRENLRRATAMGLLAPARARALGLITVDEERSLAP